MKKLSSIIFLFLGIGVFSSVLGLSQVHAQAKPELGLTIFPTTAYLSVKPGKEITHRVLLQYSGTQPIQLTARVRDFNADGTTGIPVIQDGVSFSSVSLLNPGRKLGEPFVLPPNTQYNLDLLIKPDAGIVEKEYHLVLLLTGEPLPDRIGEQTGALTTGAIASNMIVSVSESGENRGEVTISKFPMPRFVDSFGELRIAMLAENTGETATAPRGTITLHHWQGTKLKEWFVFPDVILAQSTRLLRAVATDPTTLQEGDTPKIVPLEYDAPFLFGPYNVTVQLQKPDGTTEQRAVTIVALPFSIIAAVLLAIGLYVAYRYGMSQLNAKRW